MKFYFFRVPYKFDFQKGCFGLGLLFLWRHNHDHSFPFLFWRAFGSAYLFQFFDKPVEQVETPVFENDGSANEMHVSFDLGTFLQEVFGVPGFEFKIVVVRIGAESDFFQNCLG